MSTRRFITAIVTVFLGMVITVPVFGQQKYAFPELTGEYLGQNPPGSQAELFAPGIIFTGINTRDVAITPDGNEIFYGLLMANRALIMHSVLKNGKWTEPEAAPFSGVYGDLEPGISPDGKRLFFLSNRPKEGNASVRGWAVQDIWAVDRQEDGWGQPYNIGSPVNTDVAEYFPSATNDGTLYFCRGDGPKALGVFRSRLVNGNYTEPEKLGEKVNTENTPYNAYISPDERYLIYCAQIPGGFGQSDYYINFRNNNDQWSGPVNLGDAVNSSAAAVSPAVSPDGKYFFFAVNDWNVPSEAYKETLTLSKIRQLFSGPQNGNTCIYWIDAGFIDKLRPEGF